jgi:uncharacterized protein (TIGR03435 family)
MAAGAQTQKLTFTIATVKPDIPDKPGGAALNCTSGAGFIAKEQTLLSLLEYAYDLPYNTGRVSGGPRWLNSRDTRFEIHGKVDHKVTFDECRQMLQSLLDDRFVITHHWETRETPVYLLSPAKKGPKLHQTGDTSEKLSSVTLNGAEVQLGDGFHPTASGRGMSMPELARFLSSQPAIGRPVLDKTGLEGFYGFNLDFASTINDDTRPDIFAALQEQLGLKLESARVPLKILVVEQAREPTEN